MKIPLRPGKVTQTSPTSIKPMVMNPSVATADLIVFLAVVGKVLVKTGLKRLIIITECAAYTWLPHQTSTSFGYSMMR